MGVILDTSIWVAVDRGKLVPSDVAELTKEDPVYSAPPTIAEFEYGANRTRNAAQRLKRESAIARIKKEPYLLIDPETGEIFGKLAACLDQDGTPSTHRTHDIWIVALALQHNMLVLTQNRCDFADIPGLKLTLLPK